MNGAAVALNASISIDEYLHGETLTDVRHEYLAGDVKAMGGASARHGLLVTGLSIAIGPLARRKNCQLFIADMKVRVDHSGDTYFYYSDLLLSCDPADREPYYRSRPCLLVEVLSPSTERIDRREKLFAYEKISSLREYVLVDPEQRRVEVYRFGATMRHETFTEGVFRLDCLETEVSLDEVYFDAERE